MGAVESPHLRYYSEVTASEVEWLWYPYIPFGKITLVQGDPGDGKTTVALYVASVLSRGGSMPLNEQVFPLHNSIYQSAEDNPSDTIKPRLMREGADCSRIAFLNMIDKPLTLMSDEWELAIRKIDARLLVIDPLQAYLGNDMHMQQAADMRQTMIHLSAVAERTKCAIVIIGHMNKTNGGKSLYRGLGSIDIVAAARSVLLVGRSQEDKSIRVIAQIKNSLAPEGATLAFELSEEQGIRWIGQYDMAIDEILNGSSDGSLTKVGKARDELKHILHDGRVSCNEVYAALEAEGIAKRTVDIAKKALNIVSIRIADGWYWALPFDEKEKE